MSRLDLTSSLAGFILATLTCLAAPGVATAQSSDPVPPPPPASYTDPIPEPPAADPQVRNADGSEAAPQPRAIRRRVHLAIGTHAGIAEDAGGVEGFLDWGFTGAVTIAPHLTLGITRFGTGFGYSSLEGSIWLVDFTPYAEGWLFATVALQLYARLGVSLQFVGETNLRPFRFEAAAYLSLGARWWVHERLSLELELAAFSPISDTMTFGSARIEPFSVAGTLGGGVGFHF